MGLEPCTELHVISALNHTDATDSYRIIILCLHSVIIWELDKWDLKASLDQGTEGTNNLTMYVERLWTTLETLKSPIGNAAPGFTVICDGDQMTIEKMTHGPSA